MSNLLGPPLVAGNWLGNAQDPDHWRGSHFRVAGPAAAQRQAAFLDNWIRTGGEVLHGEAYFPEIEPVGEHYAQVFKRSSSEGSESVHRENRIRMPISFPTTSRSRPWFRRSSAVSGSRYCSRQTHRLGAGTPRLARPLGDLLKAGAEIYEYLPTLYHCKIMVADDVWTTVGSTNFDSRSFRLNDEANLNIHDRAFAQEQIAVIGNDLKQSRQITLEEWTHRPLTEKLFEHLAALFRSQIQGRACASGRASAHPTG